MDNGELWNLLFRELHDDLKKEDEFYTKKPLLAHYTSLDVLEKILSSNEVWFSNPLFMNDLEEIRFGIFHGTRAIRESSVVREALETEERRTIFAKALDQSISYFGKEHLLDTYVFCLSEHAPENVDGQLSMWRGYGGGGKGCALVFDTSKLSIVEGSPLIVAQVKYGSNDVRFGCLEMFETPLARVINANRIPDDQIWIASAAVFARIKLFALFSKHHGFSEEKEWRVVYMSERDSEGKLKSMLNYFNGSSGVEPKLRFKVAPIEGVTSPDLSIDKILKSILLGPSISSPLAVLSVRRMLDVISRSELKDRLIASTIPFRAN